MVPEAINICKNGKISLKDNLESQMAIMRNVPVR